MDGKVEVNSSLKRAPELDDATVAIPGASGYANIAGLPVGSDPFVHGDSEIKYACPACMGQKKSPYKESTLSARSVSGSTQFSSV